MIKAIADAWIVAKRDRQMRHKAEIIATINRNLDKAGFPKECG